MYEEAYQKLERHLTDTIAEEQAKLGYDREALRLYYPLSSLRHFFHGRETGEELAEALAGFPAFAASRLGEVKITRLDDRFCFYLPPQAAEYVYENKEENRFIQELVALLGHHGTKMEQVVALFRKWDEACVVEPVDNGEFDVRITFRERPDDYFYCFKDEGHHLIYHRFLPEDYTDFGF